MKRNKNRKTLNSKWFICMIRIISWGYICIYSYMVFYVHSEFFLNSEPLRFVFPLAFINRRYKKDDFSESSTAIYKSILSDIILVLVFFIIHKLSEI